MRSNVCGWFDLIHKLGERGIHGMQDLLAPGQPNAE